ncbi:MAG: tRNA pseudouridine(38-40) synthase TruA [Syntrophaceae bacterium]
MDRNLRLIIEYEGTRYHGWQRQGELPTVQKVIEEVIFTITREASRLESSGRTDAGVHALGQVANFTTGARLPLHNLLRGMNSLLPDDIKIKDIAEAPADFHARFCAKSKTYLYKIDNGPVPSVFHRKYSWHIHERLNLDKMKEAADFLNGEHDFMSFCAAGHETKTYVRRIMTEEFSEKGNLIIFRVEATGFLKYMVRNLVGTLAYVGLEKITPACFKEIMDARDRTVAGPTAPPQGLFLESVKY